MSPQEAVQGGDTWDASSGILGSGSISTVGRINPTPTPVEEPLAL